MAKLSKTPDYVFSTVQQSKILKNYWHVMKLLLIIYGVWRLKFARETRPKAPVLYQVLHKQVPVHEAQVSVPVGLPVVQVPVQVPLLASASTSTSTRKLYLSNKHRSSTSTSTQYNKIARRYANVCDRMMMFLEIRNS